jgi:hypothetical protein
MNTDLSRGNGSDTYTVSVGTPIDDIVTDMEDRYDDALMLVEDLGNLHALIEEARYRAVHRARQEGHSWSLIAACLGVSKQAAQQKYGA